MEDLSNDLCGVVSEILRAHEAPLTADESLTDRGLDSLGMVELLDTIENRYTVRIPPAEITPENFATVSAIQELIVRMKAR